MGTESNITVVGGVPFVYPFERIDRVGDTIIAGNSHKSHSFRWAVTSRETVLQDMINTVSFRDSSLLTTAALYKKYVFFEQVDCLPSMPAAAVLDKKYDSLSDQSLALMLACWMGIDRIYLFGYNIVDLAERERLKTVAMLSPHNHFYYVRKPNPQKIHLYDDFENIHIIDYKEFDKIVHGHK
jgi:hypothetical protein